MRAESSPSRSPLKSPPRSDREERLETRRVETMGYGRSNTDRTLQVENGEHRKIVRQISDMGFEPQKVERMVNNFSKSGRIMDVDSILGALLGGEDEEGSNDSSNERTRSEPAVQQDRGGVRRGLTQQREFGRSQPSGRPGRDDNGEDEEAFSIEITPGVFAKLLKGRLTWEAMRDGKDVRGTCVVCTASLQCCPEADYVLCPDCNVVSPLEEGRCSVRRSSSGRVVNDMNMSSRRMTVASNVGAVGLGYKRS